VKKTRWFHTSQQGREGNNLECSIIKGLLCTRGNNGNIFVSFILKQAMASKVKRHSTMLSWQGSTHSSIEKPKKQWSCGWTLKRQQIILNWQTFNPIFFWQVQKAIVLTLKKTFPLSILWVPFAFRGYYFATLTINKMNANINPYWLTYILGKFRGNFEIAWKSMFFNTFLFILCYRIQRPSNGFRKLSIEQLVSVLFFNFIN